MFDCIFVTGGAGFIGSNFVLQLISQSAGKIINYDKLTYAGNLKNLAGLQHDPRHVFVRGDINDAQALAETLAQYQPQAIVHFAAESHVDRSIAGPAEFIRTNVAGTFQLLEAALGYWRSLPGRRREGFRFLHVSTDEVYGSLGPGDSLSRRLDTIPAVPTRPPRRRATTLCAPSTNLRFIGDDHELLQQLWPEAVPGEADSADDPERG